MKTSTKLLIALAVSGGGAGLWLAEAGQDRAVPLAELAQSTHYHGLAVDREDPSRLLLATHHGLYVVHPDTTARRISPTQDFMGFTPHPTDAKTLYASGHPAHGGNLGFIMSTDAGQTWRQLSSGVRGPVDFHQMDVSKADPKVIYGVYGGLQISRDGGGTWELTGKLPDEMIDLAASARAADTLYAATRKGLLISTDTGKSWRPAYLLQRPASMVHVLADGSVFAFVVGTGLIKATEPSLTWATLSNAFGDRYLLHFAADPQDAAKMYAVTQHSEVLASIDGGKTWQAFGSKEDDKVGARTQ
jgi:photosystem II stability/assembly factor-like uncharacterized protein